MTIWPNGAISRAKPIESGTAMKAAITPPEIILRRAMWGTPRLRRYVACGISGTAMVSPGMPSSAVGTACVMCLATAAASQKVKTPSGGTPSRTTSSVTGAIVVVSSVPEIRPTAANRIAPSSPMPPATRISCSNPLMSRVPARQNRPFGSSRRV